MFVPWTNYRFTPPTTIDEEEFGIAKQHPKAHRQLVLDELWEMFQALIRNAKWGTGTAIVAFVVVALLPDPGRNTSGLGGVVFSLTFIIGIGCAMSVIFTLLSFILFACHYTRYWRRVATTVAMCASYSEFERVAIARRLLVRS